MEQDPGDTFAGNGILYRWTVIAPVQGLEIDFTAQESDVVNHGSAEN